MENIEIKTEEEQPQKTGGAKTYSKRAMIFSGVWIAILTIIKGVGLIKNLSVQDIIYSGIAISAVWTPTYFSIFLDKIKDIKLGA